MSASLKVLKSGILLLGIQILQKGLGTISTLILARLLTPEHFGIVALVVIAIQFFEVLVDTGTQQYIVQKTTLNDTDLNTAWSLDISVKSAMCLVIMLSAPWIADFFETPELTLPLVISALVLPLKAVKSPALMKLARDINYRPFFRLTLWQKAISFTVVVSYALIAPSHWAIISGNIVSALVLAMGSYLISDFRPSWTLSQARTQWHFSKWLLLRSVVGFTRGQIDALIVSKLFGTAKLGGYNLVREISLLPAVSIINPVAEPLLAAIAQSKSDAQSLEYRTRMSLWLMISVLIPIAAFIVLEPELLILVLLGETWQEYAPLLRPFGLSFFSFPLFALICDAMIAQGRVRQLFWLDVFSTIMVIVLLLIFGTDNLNAMAWVRSILALITVLGYLLILNQQVQFGLLALGKLCLPAALGTGISILLLESAAIDLALLWEFFAKGILYVTLCLITIALISALTLRRNTEWIQLKAIVTNLKRNRN